MAVCNLGHEHPDESVPVVVEPDPGTSENDVRIEEIRAGTDVAIAEIHADERVVEMQAEMERMRGEITGMREALTLLSPPEPEPEPEPPAPAAVVALEETGDGDPPTPAETGRKPPKKSGGFWSGYATG